MKCPYLIKVCSKCRKILVAYKGNFAKAKRGRHGLASQCKQCDRQYREENKEYYQEYNKKYKEEHKEELKEKDKEYRNKHKKEKSEYDKQYYQNHKEEKSEYHKQWHREHKEEITEKKKQYYKEHKEEKLEYHKQWRKEHKEELKEKNRVYHQNNPHISLNSHAKRRQLEENQGRGITKEQWYEMMCWFDWCCAYSGEYIGGDSKVRTFDHVIALNNNGLHEPWNCVPMYKPYNSSKHTKDMLEWYIQQPYYSEERLQKIYAWCEYAFNKWKPRRKGNRKLNFF